MKNKKSSKIKPQHKNNFKNKNKTKTKFNLKIKYFVIVGIVLFGFIILNSFINRPVKYNTSHVTFNKDEELKKLEKEFFKAAEKSISSDEEYVYLEMALIEKNVVLATSIGDLLGTNHSKKSSFNLALNDNNTLKGYDVFSTFNFSLVDKIISPTIPIPFNNNEKNGFTTHTLPVAYAMGHIIEYTYDVYKKNTNEHIRRDSVYAALPTEAFIANHNVQSTDLFKIENVEGTNYEVYKSYSDFISSLNKKIL